MTLSLCSRVRQRTMRSAAYEDMDFPAGPVPPNEDDLWEAAAHRIISTILKEQYYPTVLFNDVKDALAYGLKSIHGAGDWMARGREKAWFAAGLSEGLTRTCVIPDYEDGIKVRGFRVYFLWSGDQVVYVGSSENLLARIGQHVYEKVFDRVTYVDFPDRVSMIEAEKAYIRTMKPKYNKVGWSYARDQTG